ncbi:MAG: M42 family metallopeptidase [Desulfarculaceae bacterium]|nr:M42 family metallopeptidase [Desulfarculaceae bacterium]MCF8048579.1 M42 family metallopeptidase [Desulfarculaceae bacterium]MCF8066270.1 M42 family metallopeptidase [Desulfarculaceae bacterium]MCF8098635.1 M42 family metallopeptidase [Desulfarculaceae bacterium]MCF8124236.1 M42 family metallopeptidase [Desulfarculaceae bacterium]
MSMLELLDTLCPPLGPPGREDDIREVVRRLVEPLAQRMETDRLGNLRAWWGAPDARPLVMLDAHLDEVAVIVQHIDEQGFIRVAPLGGLDRRLLPGSKVILQPRPGQRVDAVCGLLPPHVSGGRDQDKSQPWEKIFLDAGLSSAAEAAEAGLEIGTCGVLDLGNGPLGQGFYHARNLDNRAGCAVLVWLLERLAAEKRELPFGLVMNFSVAEEVGLRGAVTAAFDLAPDLALAVESTVGETPGVETARTPTRLGQGPAITVADGRIVVPLAMVDSLEATAKEAGIAVQRKRPPFGGTNAGAIHMSRGGVLTGVVSVPTRYIHSPASVLKLSDLQGLGELVWAWLGRAGELL